MPTIAYVVGARPNFMKIGPIVDALNARHPGLAQRIIHTGQHYSREMSDLFFRQLGLPAPDVNLEVGSGSHGAQTGRMLALLEDEFQRSPPDMLVVVGDVNSTLAATLAASKLGIPVAHVESGLRSRDLSMPEEINRIVTDSIANLLFVTEESGLINLGNEGRPADCIHFVGNTMIDTLIKHRSAAAKAGTLERLGVGDWAGHYALITMHRPANVDDAGTLRPMMEMLMQLSGHVPLVFPVHPRTLARIEDAGLAAGLAHSGNVHLCAPQGYLEFLNLMMDARLVLTDSGGIQEETTCLGVPCLTMRDNTERPITVTMGTNRLAGTSPSRILEAALSELADPCSGGEVPPLWDGRAGERIARILVAESA